MSTHECCNFGNTLRWAILFGVFLVIWSGKNEVRKNQEKRVNCIQGCSQKYHNFHTRLCDNCKGKLVYYCVLCKTSGVLSNWVKHKGSGRHLSGLEEDRNRVHKIYKAEVHKLNILNSKRRKREWNSNDKMEDDGERICRDDEHDEFSSEDGFSDWITLEDDGRTVGDTDDIYLDCFPICNDDDTFLIDFHEENEDFSDDIEDANSAEEHRVTLGTSIISKDDFTMDRNYGFDTCIGYVKDLGLNKSGLKEYNSSTLSAACEVIGLKGDNLRLFGTSNVDTKGDIREKLVEVDKEIIQTIMNRNSNDGSGFGYDLIEDLVGELLRRGTRESLLYTFGLVHLAYKQLLMKGGEFVNGVSKELFHDSNQETLIRRVQCVLLDEISGGKVNLSIQYDNAKGICKGFFLNGFELFLHDDGTIGRVNRSGEYIPLAKMFKDDSSKVFRYRSLTCESTANRPCCRSCTRVYKKMCKRLEGVKKSLKNKTFLKTNINQLDTRALFQLKLRETKRVHTDEVNMLKKSVEESLQRVMEDLEGSNEFYKAWKGDFVGKDIISLIYNLNKLDLIKHDDFCIKFITNQLQNKCNSKHSNHYPNLIKRFWTLFKYRANESTLNFLRANLYVPSKIITPRPSFGDIREEDVAEYAKFIESEIIKSPNISRDFIIASDATDIRGGLELDFDSETVFGATTQYTFGDFVQRRPDSEAFNLGDGDIRNATGHHLMVQFFILNLDNTICFPIGHCVVPENSCESKVTADQVIKISSLFHSHKISIIGGATDGGMTQASIEDLNAYFLANFKREYLHFYDFTHIVKNFRNAMFGSGMIKVDKNDVTAFALSTIIDFSLGDAAFYDIFIAKDVVTHDTMALDPVINLCREEVSKYLISEGEGGRKILGKYEAILQCMEQCY